MNALTTLAMYSDSEEDEDEEMDIDSSPIEINNESMNNNYDLESIEILNKQIPSIPSSPDIQPDLTQKQNITNLMKKFKNKDNYLQNRFENANFLDNPKFTYNSLNELNLFNYSDDKINKLDEYSSRLSLKIFNPINYLDEEDNVNTLIKLLEEKIRENQRKIQEKRERKEKQKQLLREQNEKRISTPINALNQYHNMINIHTQQQRYIINNINAINAAKQAVLAKKNEFIMNKKRNKNDNKNSRWDDKR
eukprot:480860_1